MSSLTINLDADALREATVQAMAGVLTPEVKEEILQKAISNVLSPSTDSWNRGKSPLEIALQEATIQIARQEAKKLLDEDDEFRTKINALLKSTAEKILNSDMDKLAERMADAFVESMRRD